MDATGGQAADVVLAGGGVTGIAHVGVLSVLHEHGYRFERAAGTSAGAIAAALVAARMSPARMHELLGQLDYRAFRDRSGRDKIPLLGPGLSLALEDGSTRATTCAIGCARSSRPSVSRPSVTFAGRTRTAPGSGTTAWS